MTSSDRRPVADLSIREEEEVRSLHPHPQAPVPVETARVAHAAFPKGHPYLTLRDEVGTLFQDDDCAGLYPHEGQPGLSPWRLAMVTILQFREP
jgi:transposase